LNSFSKIFLAAAMDYLMSHPVGNVDIKAFEESCGVGVVVTPEKIEQEVEKVIKAHLSEIKEKRLVFKNHLKEFY
jgi:glutaminyl-tRNA synthetase